MFYKTAKKVRPFFPPLSTFLNLYPFIPAKLVLCHHVEWSIDVMLARVRCRHLLHELYVRTHTSLA